MAALDFPASPSNGQQYVGPGGVIWVYDLPGTKWISGSLAAGVYVTPNTNFADNTGFAVNQRTYVTATALAAGIYGHDRWKAGAGGCTYTFAAPAGPSNAITITAGTLQQVIEGPAIVGGNYVLSWTGTAQGRVGAGSYAASPVAVTGITAGANTTIEFNAGTLSRVKFESGTVATSWQALDPVYEWQQCQRFYQRLDLTQRGYVPTAQPIVCPVIWPQMRGIPAALLITAGTRNNASSISLGVSNAGAGYFGITGVAAGPADTYAINDIWSISADL